MKGKAKKRCRARRPIRRMMEALDLPAESAGRTPKLTWLGKGDLLVENHRGILRYGENGVGFLTEEGPLAIGGKNLHMLELGAERAYIRGEICSAAYEDGSGA